MLRSSLFSHLPNDAALTMRGKDWTAISLGRFILFATHLNFFLSYINLDFMMITLGRQFVFYEFGHSPAIILRFVEVVGGSSCRRLDVEELKPHRR